MLLLLLLMVEPEILRQTLWAEVVGHTDQVVVRAVTIVIIIVVVLIVLLLIRAQQLRLAWNNEFTIKLQRTKFPTFGVLASLNFYPNTYLEYAIATGCERSDDQIVEKLTSGQAGKHWPSVESCSY